MHPLRLVLPDYCIPQRRPRVQIEDGITPVALRAPLAGAGSTVVLSPPGIEDLSGGDLDDGAV